VSIEGNDFGSLRDFGVGSPRRSNGLDSESHYANPEALSPDGVFLPPLPTQVTVATSTHLKFCTTVK